VKKCSAAYCGIAGAAPGPANLRAHGVNAASIGGKVSTCGAGRLIEISRVYGENGTVDQAIATRSVRELSRNFKRTNEPDKAKNTADSCGLQSREGCPEIENWSG
jgi:hypothetical protein